MYVFLYFMAFICSPGIGCQQILAPGGNFHPSVTPPSFHDIGEVEWKGMGFRDRRWRSMLGLRSLDNCLLTVVAYKCPNLQEKESFTPMLWE